MTDETKIKKCMDWLLSNPENLLTVNDCDVAMGTEFIARCIMRATAGREIVYPLSEFMQEKGIADKVEAESLFNEMFRQANRLLNGLPAEGLYYNMLDMARIKDGMDKKIIRFGSYFYKHDVKKALELFG